MLSSSRAAPGRGSPDFAGSRGPGRRLHSTTSNIRPFPEWQRPWTTSSRSQAVFEPKFMLPWSFSEEAAAEKYMVQLQRNMWVSHFAEFGALHQSAANGLRSRSPAFSKARLMTSRVARRGRMVQPPIVDPCTPLGFTTPPLNAFVQPTVEIRLAARCWQRVPVGKADHFLRRGPSLWFSRTVSLAAVPVERRDQLAEEVRPVVARSGRWRAVRW